MKKLLSTILSAAFLLMLATTGSSQTDKPKSYGTPKKTESEKPKNYGAPKKTESEKPKSYGSGKPDSKMQPKVYGSGGDKKVELKADPKIGPPPKTGPPSAKPNGSKFDAAASNQQKKEESKAKFIQATKPADVYTDAKGKTHHIDNKDVRISNLRSQLTEERWRNRELREQQFYSVYYTRPVVVYHDPYNSFFWYWILDRPLEQQAIWAYHHRQSMDAARYNDLMSKNADLAARVRQLESQNVPRDPAYVPQGMADNDLMYSQQYVQAAYNPVAPQTKLESGNSALTYFFGAIIIALVVALVVWLLFFKKW